MMRKSIKFSLISRFSNIQHEFLNNDVRRLHICNKRNSRNIDSTLFVQFLEEEVAYLQDKMIIWINNSSIHKILEVYQTLKRKNILALTILPYYTWLNP